MRHIESCFAREHVIDGPSKLMGEDGQRCALAMFFLSTGQQLLSVGIVTEAQGGSFGKGPREVRVPALLPRRPQAFASRCFAACDQARVRGKILHAWQAADGMACVEPHEAEDCANTGHRLEHRAGRGIVLWGGCHNRQRHVTEQLIVIGQGCRSQTDGF